jgi:DNA polymerase III epsilon subunit family exonuclease
VAEPPVHASRQGSGTCANAIATIRDVLCRDRKAPALIFGPVKHAPTPSQRTTIEADLRPLLVVAGPGSGKTFCLIERIRFLVERHRLQPDRIIAFTFTNKAAEEIATRLDELGEAAQRVRRTTIHKFCVDVLREHGTRISVDPGFGIADEEYQCALLAQLGSSVRNHKGLLQLFARHRLRGDPLGLTETRRYERYVEILRDRNMLDFDMLLLRTADALEHADAAEQVRRRWDAILVDEFQDLNPIQYNIIRVLAQASSNVFAVGDYDQSIYGWAGAEPKLFERYMNDFGITRPLFLEENRRTARHIFELARLVIDPNPSLPGFESRPTVQATRETDHAVEAFVFENAEAEAAWLIDDMRRQQTSYPDLAWGDFGLLYRTHEIGNLLEPALLMAGVPARLAHGRAVSEDPVIAWVVAALGVMLRPADPAGQEKYLSMVLPRTLTEWARSEAERRGQSMIAPLRQQLDRKGQNWEEIRRAVTSLKNLSAYMHRHHSLGTLLEELLSRRVGRYRNVLAERHIEIDDPETDTDATTLAFRLDSVLRNQRPVSIPRLGGAEIPIRAMLHEAGVRTVHLGQHVGCEVIGAGGEVSGGVFARTVFKAAQILTARKFEGTFTDYTTVDIESTGLDRKRCEVVEIAAVRVRKGQPVAEYHTLVKPRVSIEPGATAVHGISWATVEKAPHFEQIWADFRDFCGDDVLVAHNGEDFDFPVIRRMAKGLPGVQTLATYDSMPLAYEITPASHRQEDLARQYGIDTGRAHSALDDARTLARVFARLNREKVTRSRKSANLQLLDHLGVALALSQPLPDTTDARVLFEIARPFALGIFGDALTYYEAMWERGLPTVDDVIDRLGGRQLMERIRRERSAEERYPSSMQRLRMLATGMDGLRLREQLELLLERVALSGREAGEDDTGRVSLLTLHATKGLEFSRVYMVGAEDGQFFKNNDTREEQEESRRVFYVGMTRAKDRLVFTRALSRGGKPTGGSQFLDELGISQRPVESRGPASTSPHPGAR